MNLCTYSLNDLLIEIIGKTMILDIFRNHQVSLGSTEI